MSAVTNELLKAPAMPIDVEQSLQQLLPSVEKWRERSRPAAAETPDQAGACADRKAEHLLGELEPTLAGDSPSITKLRQMILEVAPTRASVMIFGEGGTCKEAVARVIHRLSKQAGGAFVPVNMATVPPGLAEQFLFGREVSAATSGGVAQIEQGCCEAADGGTLFLDEVADIELRAQPKLLRFLQESMLQRIGSPQALPVSVRVITGTNRDPAALVASGRIREDLFFRLHVAPIYIAPLRDRPEDIPELANHFLRQAALRHERPVVAFSDEAMRLLQEHDWPGNVCQLENVVERLVVFSHDSIIEVEQIPAEEQLASAFAARHRQAAGGKADASNDSRDSLATLTPIERHERAAIVDALRRTGGHAVSAAQILGMGQATVYRKIKQYVIPHERKRRRAPH